MRPPIVVIKVGGSLLDWPELPARLIRWMNEQEPCRPILIVGGGSLANCIRDLDTIHNLGESAAHALALRTLDITGYVLHDLVQEITRVEKSIDGLASAWKLGLVPILLPRQVLDHDDRANPAHALPHCWDVTTDAIAGRIAVLVNAGRIVLLKSAPAPTDLNSAAALGLVDPWFERARGNIVAKYVDLRSCLPPINRGD